MTQFAAGLDKARNREQVASAIAAAADRGADLVIAPEAAMHDFGPADLALAPVAEPLDGPFVTAVADAARRHRVTVVAGMFEAVSGDDSHVYNSVIAVGPDGALTGRYRKQHLFDALGWVESDRLLPGDPAERLVFDCGGVRIGVMTCYDVRFPELGRALADDGADLIAIPSAWVAGPNKLAQWRALTTARAIENVCYVAGAVQTPPTYTGGSIVVDPWGEVLASLDAEDGVAVADVEPERVVECRKKMPSLDNRRWQVEPR
ncbi:MAG TPA: carbon-nitrogen hydrolase family protein [Mycobacteriales bacterium]|nr:carbon-nitrogen hydrolase family protein [Mycobacteriales bacterium]